MLLVNCLLLSQRVLLLGRTRLPAGVNADRNLLVFVIGRRLKARLPCILAASHEKKLRRGTSNLRHMLSGGHCGQQLCRA
jgi:hypothetical protein